MGALIARIGAKAEALAIPLNAHLDLTWRCNERCGHCYLDHSLGGEMTTAEMQSLLEQLAEAGCLFLVLSGGEIMLRADLFEILAHARSLQFDVRLKTNGTLVGEREAERLAVVGVREVHISVYSYRPEVHDAITRVSGSLNRSLEAVRRLKRRGIGVSLRCLIMRSNQSDYLGVRALADELGVRARFDVQVTPRMDGGWGPVAAYGVSPDTLCDLFQDTAFVGENGEFCRPPAPAGDELLDAFPCSAGHSACYIAPNGDVTPCVQFPVACGNVRQAAFSNIWRDSPRLLGIREIRNRNVGVCSSCANLSVCSRCPGLAYREGDMAGPSSLECRKAYARTGVPSPPMEKLHGRAPLRHPEGRGAPPFPPGRTGLAPFRATDIDAIVS